MGYQVYRDPEGHDRWAGYGVPAICDWIGCDTAIDRGLAYKCEEHIVYVEHDDEVDEEIENPGCGLYFCEPHLAATNGHHDAYTEPKPDTAEWNQHLLTDESWQQWRDENPATVARLNGHSE